MAKDNSFEQRGSRRGATVTRKLACENQQFFIFFDEIVSAGEISQNYLVVAPKIASANFVTGVAVLPLCDGKIGLLRIYRHAIEEDSWEIPRGFIERAETPLDSALRELREETGLTCARDQVKPLGFVTPDAGILAARVQVFAALGCRREGRYEPAELGHEQFSMFEADEIRRRILNSEIQDPCTVAAFFRYAKTFR
ncbi:MAG TPA: NUDIX hydrolase [Candidatus Binatia bacterium]|jgi:8-oxo-dGTP pyrophosphatase MutT (NUDIX family)